MLRALWAVWFDLPTFYLFPLRYRIAAAAASVAVLLLAELVLWAWLRLQ